VRFPCPSRDLKSRLREVPQGREIVAYCRGPYCLYADHAVQLLTDEGTPGRQARGGLPRVEGGRAADRTVDHVSGFRQGHPMQCRSITPKLSWLNLAETGIPEAGVDAGTAIPLHRHLRWTVDEIRSAASPAKEMTRLWGRANPGQQRARADWVECARRDSGLAALGQHKHFSLSFLLLSFGLSCLLQPHPAPPSSGPAARAIGSGAPSSFISYADCTSLALRVDRAFDGHRYASFASSQKTTGCPYVFRQAGCECFAVARTCAWQVAAGGSRVPGVRSGGCGDTGSAGPGQRLC